jgi:hypothetical protein
VAYLELEAVRNALSVSAIDAINWFIILTKVLVKGTLLG